jgi:hypothetical protein
LVKLFEKVLRKYLIEHMNKNNHFNENQHGFRQGRSCLSQLIEQYDLILSLLDREANVDVVYLDFSKAFDKVDHQIVLRKIEAMGINGNILQWIKSFLTQRYQSVSVNGVLSDPQEVISGVPQGSVLGPLIFLILISDIDADVIDSIVKSFADDTRATKGVWSVDDAAKLQEDLQRIYEWTEDNNMQLNDVKFELLCLSVQSASQEFKLDIVELHVVVFRPFVNPLEIFLEFCRVIHRPDTLRGSCVISKGFDNRIDNVCIDVTYQY